MNLVGDHQMSEATNDPDLTKWTQERFLVFFGKIHTVLIIVTDLASWRFLLYIKVTK